MKNIQHKIGNEVFTEVTNRTISLGYAQTKMVWKQIHGGIIAPFSSSYYTVEVFLNALRKEFIDE